VRFFVLALFGFSAPRLTAWGIFSFVNVACLGWFGSAGVVVWDRRRGGVGPPAWWVSCRGWPGSAGRLIIDDGVANSTSYVAHYCSKHSCRHSACVNSSTLYIFIVIQSLCYTSEYSCMDRWPDLTVLPRRRGFQHYSCRPFQRPGAPLYRGRKANHTTNNDLTRWSIAAINGTIRRPKAA
jgi:hypothetical protein